MFFHEAVGRTLRAQGTDVVFGVLGDGNLFLMDSFRRDAGGRYLAMANEAGAVLAANGYARTSGRLGVATVTHGPALTNTVTALVESVRERTPIVLIAGDTAVADRENLQNIDQREVVTATGAGFEQVRTADTVAEDLARAVRTAELDHRPVVLNVPADFQWATVKEPVTPRPKFVAPQSVLADPAALDAAAGVIANSSRPIVVAGRGAAGPAARTALLRLAERIGAPVATTLRGKDMFRGEPFDLGIFGTLSSALSLEVIERCDCVIVMGAALNRWTAAEGALLRGKRVVHVDVDRAALAQWFDVDAPVVGDVRAVAEQIVALLDEGGVPASGFASAELAARLAVTTPAPALDSSPGTVNLLGALVRLDEAFPADRTVVCDAGRWLPSAFTRLHVPEPRAYVHTVNFGSIGLGMANAVGAYVGAPERPVLMVCGDGGFMLGGLTEFNSAVRHGVDVVVVVLDDGAYGAEHVQFREHELDPVMSTFQWPDFAAVARSLGGIGYTVRSAADLDGALAALPGRDRPVLIDVKIDPDRVPDHRV